MAGRRSMLDLGHYAVLRLGDEEWSGGSGRALRTLPSGAPGADQALWLVEALTGAVAARTAPAGDLVVTVDPAAVGLWHAPPPQAVAGIVELGVLPGGGGALRSIRWSDGEMTQAHEPRTRSAPRWTRLAQTLQDFRHPSRRTKPPAHSSGDASMATY